MTQYRPDTIADRIRFCRQRIAAFRHVLATRSDREAELEKEGEALRARIRSLEKTCAEAPAAIDRAQKELDELTHVESMRLATRGLGGSSGPDRATRVARMIDRRKHLLERLAELEASLGEEESRGAVRDAIEDGLQAIDGEEETR